MEKQITIFEWLEEVRKEERSNLISFDSLSEQLTITKILGLTYNDVSIRCDSLKIYRSKESTNFLCFNMFLGADQVAGFSLYEKESVIIKPEHYAIKHLIINKITDYKGEILND